MRASNQRHARRADDKASDRDCKATRLHGDLHDVIDHAWIDRCDDVPVPPTEPEACWVNVKVCECWAAIDSKLVEVDLYCHATGDGELFNRWQEPITVVRGRLNKPLQC